MLDPITLKRLADLRQKEIMDSIYGVQRLEPQFSLRVALTDLWHKLHSSTPQDWKPPRPAHT